MEKHPKNRGRGGNIKKLMPKPNAGAKKRNDGIGQTGFADKKKRNEWQDPAKNLRKRELGGLHSSSGPSCWLLGRERGSLAKRASAVDVVAERFL